MSFSKEFDAVVVNDSLPEAVENVTRKIVGFTDNRLIVKM